MYNVHVMCQKDRQMNISEKYEQYTKRQTQRERERQTDRETDRQTDRERERETRANKCYVCDSKYVTNVKHSNL